MTLSNLSDGRIIYRQRAQGVGHIEIARPNKRGALTNNLMRDLLKLLESCELNSDIRTVLLSSKGKAFSAGADLESLSGETPPDDPGGKIFEILERYSKPIVAAVQGAAVGMGATMLLHCDAIVASPDAYMRMPFIELGMTPEGGATVVLPSALGPARAKKMLMLAEPLTASEAVSSGLWTEITSHEDTLVRAEEIATQLASYQSKVLSRTKELMRDPDSTARFAYEMDVFRNNRQEHFESFTNNG